MKNTGKPSEEEFEIFWARLGKRAYVYTFVDSSRATGRNKGKGLVMIDPQPADRLGSFDGVIHFAEVKSTALVTDRFDFKLLQRSQTSAARQVLAAGCPYFVYMHFIVTDEWFRIPYQVIDWYKSIGKSSIPKVDLIEKGLRWNFPTTT